MMRQSSAKTLLFRYLLRLSANSSKREKGYVLALSVVIGLIMLTIGAAMVARSQVDRVTAISQRATAQGEAAAEAGLALYQNLITNNRAIANFCSATNTVGDGCQGNTAWANADSWNRSATRITTCNSDATPAIIQAAAGRTDWTNIDSNDLAKGQYRLVEYTLPNANRTLGRLTVDGRSSDDEQRAGITRLQAEISIRPGGSSAAPALWLRLNGGTSDLRNNRFNGNIRLNLASPCTLPNWISTNNLVNPDSQSIITEPQVSFPVVPSFPITATTGYYDLTSGNPTQITSDSRIWGTGGNNSAITFPRSGDVPAADGRYHYQIDRLVRNGNSRIDIVDNVEVVFYVRSTIDIGGNVRINCAGTGNICTLPNTGSAGQLTIYGNVSGIYGTCQEGGSGNDRRPCDGSSLSDRQNTNTIQLSGTSRIRAFILAPNATAAVNGGGANDDSAFTGVVWVNNWNASSANNKIMVNGVGSYGDYLSDAATFDLPAISPVRSWTRLRVP
ncbi:hypothetical protein VZG28_07015 [Synechococcus elongatus IITB4]|uniref:hypothetical protein n=1 Tax=Synechococcus elongatus TaxID=32046 RepID=UPI0030D2B0CB